MLNNLTLTTKEFSKYLNTFQERMGVALREFTMLAKNEVNLNSWDSLKMVGISLPLAVEFLDVEGVTR